MFPTSSSVLLQVACLQVISQLSNIPLVISAFHAAEQINTGTLKTSTFSGECTKLNALERRGEKDAEVTEEECAQLCVEQEKVSGKVCSSCTFQPTQQAPSGHFQFKLSLSLKYLSSWIFSSETSGLCTLSVAVDEVAVDEVAVDEVAAAQNGKRSRVEEKVEETRTTRHRKTRDGGLRLVPYIDYSESQPRVIKHYSAGPKRHKKATMLLERGASMVAHKQTAAAVARHSFQGTFQAEKAAAQNKAPEALKEEAAADQKAQMEPAKKVKKMGNSPRAMQKFVRESTLDVLKTHREQKAAAEAFKETKADDQTQPDKVAEEMAAEHIAAAESQVAEGLSAADPEKATEALVAQPQKTTADEEESSDEPAFQQMATEALVDQPQQTTAEEEKSSDESASQ